MNSYIDVAAVHRHLQSLGHAISLEEAANLLDELGFHLQKQRNDERPTPLAQTPPYANFKDSKYSEVRENYGLETLTARLDALERRLSWVDAAQPPVPSCPPANAFRCNQRCGSGKLRTKSQRVPSACSTCGWCRAASTSPACMPSDEVQQLRDYAACRWPSVRSREQPTQGTSNSTIEECDRDPARRTRRGKSDPVARYQ